MMKVLNSNATSKDGLDFSGHTSQHIQDMFLEDCNTNLSLSLDDYKIYMDHKQTEEEKKFITKTHHANRHRSGNIAEDGVSPSSRVHRKTLTIFIQIQRCNRIPVYKTV
eukprot:Pgem_evm1s16688